MLAKKNQSEYGEKITLGLYGYDYQQTNLGKIPVINKAQKKAIEIAYKVFLSQRISYKKIADELNKDDSLKPARGKQFTQTQIKRILSRPEYCGMVIDSSTELLYDSPYFDSIISKADWIKVQMNLPTKTNRKRAHDKLHFPLSGLVYCSVCKVPYYAKSDKYYYCKHRKHRDGSLCSNSHSYISKKKLEELVITAVRYNLFDFNNTADIMNTINENEQIFEENESDFLELKQQISNKNEALNNVLSSPSGTFEEQELLQEQIDRLKKALEAWRLLRARPLEDELDKSLTSLSPLDKTARYELIHQLVKRIIITNTLVRIEFYHGIPMSIKLDAIKKEVKRLEVNMEYGFYHLAERKEKNNVSIFIDKILASHKSVDEIDDEDYIDFLYETKIENSRRKNIQVNKPLKHGDFINASNSRITFDSHRVYQINGQGDYYIQLLGKKINVEIIERNETPYMIVVYDEIFINRNAIFLEAPQKLQFDDHNYFFLDGVKYFFRAENGSITVYEQTANGVTRSSFDTVMKLISTCIDFHFVE